LASKDAEKSATETIRDSPLEAGSLATLGLRFQHTLEIAARRAYRALIAEAFEKDLAERIVESPHWAVLRRAPLLAEQADHSAGSLLQRAARRDRLDTVAEPAERLDLRISTHLDKRPFAAAHSYTVGADIPRPSTATPLWDVLGVCSG
jgi:hypothetical protein